jgi:hypothetical protein
VTVLTLTSAVAGLVLLVGVAGYGDRDVVDRTTAAVEQVFDDSRQGAVDARKATTDGLSAVRDRLVDTGGEVESAVAEATTTARSGIADAIDAVERLLDQLEDVVRA